ncbi:GHKL domain-containing protein [Sinomicrobium pectinilyticum]|uniref:histidine kinase n=1 Tax=Sinomicrobium pectinilyticum TaxID=1084421 RepID=A0A3N0DP06_SINP1|nr:ATP-binding protein [Sinomicrobium pectinilyticum]RNL77380.1 GHKL domain-containing protein [Sinomicrobium pectinilyticum]
MEKYFTRLLVVLPFVFFSIATAKSFQDQDYIFEWYTDSEGLPQNSIKDIFFDVHGYLWLSTENGVSRFDGSRFKNFDNTNIPGSTSNRMRFFYGSSSLDSIFISNSHNQTFLIHDRVVQHITSFDSFDNRAKSIIAENRFKFGNISNDNHFIGRRKSAILQQTGNKYYLIEIDKISEYNGRHETPCIYHYPLEHRDQAFMYNDQLYILTGENKLVLCSEGNCLTLYKIGPGKTPIVYTNDISNQVFLYSQDTHNLFYAEQLSDSLITKHILSDFNLQKEAIKSIYFDANNDILYLGSSAQGLCIVKKRYFRNISTGYGNNDDVEYAVSKLNDSVILTGSGALIKDGQLTGHHKQMAWANKYFICPDRNMNLWMKRGSVLYRFKKEDSYNTYNQWLFDSHITALYLDKDQKLWISTCSETDRSSDLFYLNVLSDVREPLKKERFPFKITCLEKQSDATLLLGTEMGLYRYYPEKENAEVEKIECAGTANIREIQTIGDGTWITTYNKGYFLYHDNEITSFPLDHNSALSTSHTVIDDKNGFLWITTNKGLFQVSRQSIDQYVKNKKTIPYYHFYDKSCGFTSNEFNGGGKPNSAMLPNGDLYLPSLAGLVYFNSRNIKPILPGNHLYIDELEIDNQSFRVRDTFNIKQDFKRITFYTSSPHYGNQANNQVEVKLEANGAKEQNWTLLGRDMAISYTNLNPGEYIFTARKKSGFNSGYTYKQFIFYIPFPFYQAYWFKISAGLFLLLLIHLGVRLRLQYIKNKNVLLSDKINEHTQQLNDTITALRKTENNLGKQNESQKKLIATLTHDIKNPLGYIAYVSHEAYRQFDGKDRIMKDHLKSIYTSSHQLSELITNLLDYTKIYDNSANNKPRVFNIHLLAEQKIALFRNLAESQRTKIINAIPPFMNIILNKEFISIIIHNLIDNAIKNTSNGIITIGCMVLDQHIIISVRDSGKGMPPEVLNYYRSYQSNIDDEMYKKKYKGMGIKIISELLAIMQGTLEIDSQPGKGTHIRLVFHKDVYSDFS